MGRDPFKPDNDRFQRGDLIRHTNPDHPEIVTFARAFRVHQSWIELTPGKDGPMKYECELVDRPTEDGVDFGYLALPESEIRMLRKLAKTAGADALAAKLKAELERIRHTWRHPEADAC